MKKHEIKPVNEDYFAQIIELSNAELGKDYITENDLLEFTTDTNCNCCKVAIINNEIAGFVLTKILNKDQLLNYLRIPENDIPKYISYASEICLIKTIAVANKYQNRGLGFKLIKAIYKDLILINKIHAVCSIAWKNGDKINANGILSSIGLKKITEIENYWENDSIENNYSCPCCGKPPCHCSAVLYFCSK